jgi:hypothetical protein
MGYRFRPEAQLFSSGTAGLTGSATTAIVTAAQLPLTLNRVGVFRMILVARAAASSFQFKDSAGNIIGAIYTLTAAGSTVTLDTPINGDPWWMTGPSFTFPNNPLGVGLSIAIGTGVVDADIWWAFGA